MTISQGLILVCYGNKKDGVTHKKWYRITRRKWSSVVSYFSNKNNFYYAKVYHYNRLGKKRGHIGNKIGYIYLKDNIVTDVIE